MLLKKNGWKFESKTPCYCDYKNEMTHIQYTTTGKTTSFKSLINTKKTTYFPTIYTTPLQ